MLTQSADHAHLCLGRVFLLQQALNPRIPVVSLLTASLVWQCYTIVTVAPLYIRTYSSIIFYFVFFFKLGRNIKKKNVGKNMKEFITVFSEL